MLFTRDYWMPVPNDYGACLDVLGILEKCDIDYRFRYEKEHKYVRFKANLFKFRKFKQEMDENFQRYPKMVVVL